MSEPVGEAVPQGARAVILPLEARQVHVVQLSTAVQAFPVPWTYAAEPRNGTISGGKSYN